MPVINKGGIVKLTTSWEDLCFILMVFLNLKLSENKSKKGVKKTHLKEERKEKEKTLGGLIKIVEDRKGH